MITRFEIVAMFITFGGIILIGISDQARANDDGVSSSSNLNF